MMRILFLADPNSVHDIKWMTFFSRKHLCFLVSREEHLVGWDRNKIRNLNQEKGIEIIGGLKDFSIKLFFNNFRQASLLKQLILKYKIDLFHILYAEPNALWAVFRKKLDIPILLTTRGSDILKVINHFFERKDILAYIVRNAYIISFKNIDKIISTSAAQINLINELFGREDTVKIYTGINIKGILEDTSITLPEAVGNIKPFLFFPRFMRPIYNHELAIDSIKLLPGKIKNKYSFVFLDKDNDDQNYVSFIEEKMREVLNADFIFLPRQDQKTVFELYKRSSLVVMTPDSDGSPVSAMEAMVCGCPVILPELNYDSDLFNPSTVFFFSEYTPSSLANQINFVINNQDRVKLIADNAKKNIIEKGDRVKEMTRLYNIYQELL